MPRRRPEAAAAGDRAREAAAPARTELSVTEIGEFIRFQSCERRFKLGLNHRQLARSVPFSERLFNTLDPVLQEVGREAENHWELALRNQGLADLTQLAQRPQEQRATSWQEFRAVLEGIQQQQSSYGREVEVRRDLGQFTLKGRIDFFVLIWTNGTLRIRLVEGKASRKDRTYHRIQLAAYVAMLRLELRENPLTIAGVLVDPDAIEAAVVRIDEVTNEPQDMLDRPTLNLDTELADVERLLALEGPLSTIVNTDLDQLGYQLDSKCDSCVFSVHCFPETARQRKLELIGITPTTCRTLRANGIADVDALAALDPGSAQATAVKRSPGFDSNLLQLITAASARRSTLPRGDDDPDNFQVRPLPQSGPGQLPEHDINGQRLVRIYLEVNYDYSENRVGGLAAHVTTSEFQLHTPFDQQPRPSADIVERRRTNPDEEGAAPAYESRILLTAAREVVHYQTQPWEGVAEQDTATERQLVQQFLFDLIDAIAEVAQVPAAPIHFYVYSRSEMTQLIEACTRAGSSLLSHLRQLLGCRENLEQLIFSCIQDEIDTRYTLGWTSRGLSVAASLSWFGQRFHWVRRVGGVSVPLDEVFEQDIFDFKTTLELNAAGGWSERPADTVGRHRFEIRSRFHDTLTAPYWRAVWRRLPRLDDPNLTDQRVRAAIIRYNRAIERPGLLRSYMAARVQALRWLDERVRFKNPEIEKPALDIATLNQFELGIDTTARAAIDFLQLDHHVGMTDWLTRHIQPLATRVQSGRSIPVRNARARADRTIDAEFDTDVFGLTGAEIGLRSVLSEGSFVRLTPRNANPDASQTIRQLTNGGITCVVQSVDWENGRLSLSSMYGHRTAYVLGGMSPQPNSLVFDFASVDESPSDFVAGRVEARLRSQHGRHIYAWFEPSDPQVPAQTAVLPARLDRIRRVLSSWQIPGPVPARLIDDQRSAILQGLTSRVQLLKGPPGTGKTLTTSASILSRILSRPRDGLVVLIAAHTHLAVNTLMDRLALYTESFGQEAIREGLEPTPIILTRVHSSDAPPSINVIQNFNAEGSATRLNRWSGQGVLVIGGTTSALLKMVEKVNEKRPFRQRPGGFQAHALVVDEASMMVLPHFLSLASLVTPDGEIMLAGDNRQLAPIVAHDWENEDRPPAQFYQPFKSAYEAVLRLREESNLPAESIVLSPLTYTFRLPPVIRDLIARVYRDLDAIELLGPDHRDEQADAEVVAENWGAIWAQNIGLVLIVHSERESRQSNRLESIIVQQVINARPAHVADSIAVITPHRAQRSLLREALQQFDEQISMIDTVERLQGGERPIIIVSGTESDPHAIGSAASFILNLNRANVAFSRTQERLIVVCAETLLDHIPEDLEDYESAFLWKSLRNLCSRELLAADVEGFRVRAFVPALRPGRN